MTNIDISNLADNEKKYWQGGRNTAQLLLELFNKLVY